MRILIISTGSAGDVNPYIGLGRTLVSRGHAVRMIANPHFERRILEAGLGFVPVGTEPDFLAVLHRPNLMHPFWGNFVVWDAIVKWTPALLEAAERAIAAERPDVIVQHHIAGGVSWVCDRHGIPRVVGALAPSIFLSAADWAGTGRSSLTRAKRGVFLAARHLLAPTLVQVGLEWRLERVARRMGYPRPRPMIELEWYGGDATLGMWSPSLRPGMPDDPPRSRVTGFSWFDEGHGLGTEDDAEWSRIEQFLGEGEPPVVFSLGSTAVHTPGAPSFFDMASQACESVGRRAILLVGNAARPRDRDSLPAGVAAFRYAPFSRIFPRGCISVIHGGIGSCGQALQAGSPVLVIPHAFDQFDNAKRLKRLGIAEVLPRRRVTAERLAGCITRLLGDESYRRAAERIAKHMSSEDGGVRAAEVIESFERA
jgi:rhamnosyltransferase subunit B